MLVQHYRKPQGDGHGPGKGQDYPDQVVGNGFKEKGILKKGNKIIKKDKLHFGDAVPLKGAYYKGIKDRYDYNGNINNRGGDQEHPGCKSGFFVCHGPPKKTGTGARPARHSWFISQDTRQ
jgi:hypothetical protein